MSSQELRNRLRNALREIKFSQELQNLIDHTTGSIFYVDSVGGQAANTGLASDEALTTIDAAVALCAADKGDIIYVLPGHVESLGNAQIDLDVAGISVIGLGHGSARPRIDYDNANSSINIGANGVILKNITLRPSVTDVLIGIDIVTLITDTLLEDIEALPGEDGAGVDDFDKVIELKVGCDRTVIRRLKVRMHASGAGYIAGIHISGASDDIIIEDPDIHIVGAGVIAPINGITTLSTNLNIIRGYLTSDAEPGIELLTGTTGIIDGTKIFTDVTTIDNCVVGDGMAYFDVRYCEAGNQAGTLVKTEST